MANRSDAANAVIALLGDRPVAYHPALARVLGSVKAAIFACQLLYWHEKGKRTDGYIWKTQQEWEDETGLSRHEQDGARAKLKELGILEEKLRGVPATVHYRLDVEKLANQIVENQQTRLPESGKLDCEKPSNQSAENQQTIPETSSETISETTQENTTTGAHAPAVVAPLIETFYPELKLDADTIAGWDLLIEKNCASVQQMIGTLCWARPKGITDPAVIGRTAMKWNSHATGPPGDNGKSAAELAREEILAEEAAQRGNTG